MASALRGTTTQPAKKTETELAKGLPRRSQLVRRAQAAACVSLLVASLAGCSTAQHPGQSSATSDSLLPQPQEVSESPAPPGMPADDDDPSGHAVATVRVEIPEPAGDVSRVQAVGLAVNVMRLYARRNVSAKRWLQD
jgi:hypothetical protein